jgi:hypothetical protein
MAYPTRTRTGHRYLGNTNKMEVHDQQKEDTSKAGCQIDEFLKAGHGVYFSPDTLEQAHKEAYDNCAKCIGSSRR